MDNQPIVKYRDMDLSFFDAIEGKKTIKITVDGKLAIIIGVVYSPPIENKTELNFVCTVDEDL